MKLNVTAFLNQQDRYDKSDERRINRINKEKVKKSKVLGGCVDPLEDDYFKIPNMNNDTIYIIVLENKNIYHIVWDDIRNTGNQDIKYSYYYDKKIVLIKNLNTFNSHIKDGFALSLNILNEFHNSIDETLYLEIKDRIEILKLLLIFRSKEPNKFLNFDKSVTRTWEKIFTTKIIQDNTLKYDMPTLNEQIYYVITDIFMKSKTMWSNIDFVDEIKMYEEKGVDIKYIIYEILPKFSNDTFIKSIDKIYKKYLENK